MAGDWLKFEKDTPNKPEVFAIAAALGITRDDAVGKLIRLWAWFDSHTVKGNAPRVTALQLDEVVGVTGFIAAMAVEGWAQIDGTGITLPNFDRHNGETAKQRALTAKRVQKHKVKGNASGNAADTGDALPREEKRREDSEKQKATGQQAGQDAAQPENLPADIPVPVPLQPVEVENDPPPVEVPKRITGKAAKQTAARFPEFWAAYPVKKGRADALKKWMSKGCDAMADQIIAHVRRMERQDDDWLRGFIPHGSTYINGERWEDEPKKDKVATTPAPAAETFGPAAALAKTESKLENAIGYIRQQHSMGVYGEGVEAEKERDRRIAEATAKHRAAAGAPNT